MELLHQKHIGLIACPASLETKVRITLEQANACFAHIDANAVRPGAPELERYDALLLYVADGAAELDWFRPEILRLNTRPLLLAGQAEAVRRRVCLQAHVDDVIFPPFLGSELVFRLYRLTAGTGERRHPAARSGKPCVLVADDDPDIVIYLKTVFRDLDVETHFVSDGAAALATARRLLPDLLMLDVGMPVMNGIDVLRSLRSDPGTSALVTVLLTGPRIRRTSRPAPVSAPWITFSSRSAISTLHAR
jgi:hypothetical protein